MIQFADGVNCPGIVNTRFDPQRTLSDGWKHLAGRQGRAYPLLESEPAEAGAGKQQCIILSFIKLAQSRVYVPTKFLKNKVAAQVLQLRQPSGTRGAYRCILWERVNRSI